VKVSCLNFIPFKNNDEQINSRSKFKRRAENITAGDTGQQNLNDRAEGLTESDRQ
jgi:hypothetical protein